MSGDYRRGDVVGYRSYLAQTRVHVLAYVFEAPRAVRRESLCRRLRGAYILGSGVVENHVEKTPERQPTCELCIKRWAEVQS